MRHTRGKGDPLIPKRYALAESFSSCLVLGSRKSLSADLITAIANRRALIFTLPHTSKSLSLIDLSERNLVVGDVSGLVSRCLLVSILLFLQEYNLVSQDVDGGPFGSVLTVEVFDLEITLNEYSLTFA